MQVKAVLFDLFDTLLLLKENEAFYKPSLKRLHEFLSKNGVNIAFEDFEKVYFEIRDKLYSESRECLEEPHFNVRIIQTLQRFGYNFDVSNPIVTGATEAFSEEFMKYVSLDEESVEVLKKLHGKYKLGLISNLAIPECAWKLLEKFDLKKYFDVIVISGDINRRKPSPEIFKKALKSIGVKASNAIFVGDMIELDVVGPKKVGMKTVLIQRRPIEKNVNVKPDKVITCLNELLDSLEDC